MAGADGIAVACLAVNLASGMFGEGVIADEADAALGPEVSDKKADQKGGQVQAAWNGAFIEDSGAVQLLPAQSRTTQTERMLRPFGGVGILRSSISFRMSAEVSGYSTADCTPTRTRPSA